MGDGDLTTNVEILPFCTLPDAEVCASTTDLAGIIVNNTDLVNDGLEEACEISLEDVELQTCPEGTALEGVAINSTFTDTTPPDGIPDVCTVSGLEICPVGTAQEGHFVMGDGNLTTDQVDDDTLDTYDGFLDLICNASDDQAEVCPTGTQLAGILVNNTVADPSIEPACNPFETCPAGTVLEGVIVNSTSPDNNGDEIPDVCEQENLAALLETCISYWLSLADGATRTGTITAIVVGAAQLVENAAPPADDLDNYPFLASYDLNNDDDITDAGEFVCTTSNTELMPA